MLNCSIQKKLNFSSGKQLLKVDFQLAQSQFLTLYGASGAGKTSILRILAGLLTPESGRIVVNGTTWLDTEKKINLSPQKRRVGFLFQDYALFPNMTVRENLVFALLKNQSPTIIEDLIALTELKKLQHRLPNTLSGGQQQRVALARALVQQPQLLLLDEPLSALDKQMRDKLQAYILQMHQQYHLTTIMVSHDIPEIVKMTDEVIVLEQGAMVQRGKPIETFPNAYFQLPAIIKNIQTDNNSAVVSLLIGEQLIQQTVAPIVAAQFVVGESVWVDMAMTSLRKNK